MDKEQYKEQVGKLIEENSRLKDKVKELETELYYWNRNKKLVESTEKNIYESADGGKTIYKRRIGDTDRERIR